MSEKSITQLLEEIRDEICAKACKYYDQVDGDEIYEICKTCPLTRI